MKCSFMTDISSNSNAMAAHQHAGRRHLQRFTRVLGAQMGNMWAAGKNTSVCRPRNCDGEADSGGKARLLITGF